MVRASKIVALHDAWNAIGHGLAVTPPLPASPLEELVLQQHKANFDLWHEEDKARDIDAADAVIAEVKHSIDRLNQLRNDLMEQVDLALLREVEQNPNARQHSETPGLIVDRLSILSLKVFHSHEEAERADATVEHRERNRSRWALIEEQRADLATALDELWSDIQAGQRQFKLYRQMKMYNDPELNPVLYRRSGARNR